MNNGNELFDKLTDFLKNEAKTETLIGQSFQLGEFTCVPIIKVGMGFGGGFGEGNDPKHGKGGGTGGGAGLGMEPIGFLVSKGDNIQFIATHLSKGLGAAFEKLPDVLEKFMESRKGAEAGN